MNINDINDEIFDIALKISKPINYLDLETRSYNALRRWGINSIADVLAAKRENKLPKIRNLGEKSIYEIDYKLERYLNGETNGK